MRFICTFFIRFASRARRVTCLAMLAIALCPAFAGAATIGSGHSGMWYDPARNGEGLQLEILDANRATVYWFTYDAQGNQRWFGGVGQIVHGAGGDSIQFPDMYVTQGGKFGPGFNPDDVKFQTVGNVSLTFADCNNGTFKYTAFGQSQMLPIQRLTQTMGAGCQSINGVPGEPVQAYAGQSGNWYDTSHNGEGFDLQWMSNGQAIVSWYTYDTQGNQAWVMGVGSQQNSAIVFDNLFTTSGPKFGTAFDTTQYQEKAWGTLTLTLTCDGGTAHYASTQPGFGSGDFTLTRLTALQKPACPYVQPKFSDLYDIAWDEIPVSDGSSDDPHAITATSIANNGTIAGLRDGHLVLWHPDTRTWEDIQRDLATYAPVFISPDGLSVVSVDGPDSGPNHTLLWQRQTGWQALPSAFSVSAPIAVSRDFKTVAGFGANSSDPNSPYSVWVSPISVNGAQNVLPTPLNFMLSADAVSNDGNTVLGSYVPGGDVFSPTIALRWDNGSGPTVMHSPAGDTLSGATACDANCNIIFGSGLYVPGNSTKPHSKEAWYLKSDGTFGFLGAVEHAAQYNWYGISATTSDGSLAIGTYNADVSLDPYGQIVWQNDLPRPFLWSQVTGTVPILSLTHDLGIGDTDWFDLYAANLSQDGMHMLMVGHSNPTLLEYGHSRAVVLRLTPKASAD